MTKITTLLFALTVQVAVSANANDSLRHCYQQLDIANSGIQTLKTENRELKAKIRTLNKTIDTQKTETDSLKGELTAAKNDITALADSLNVNISNTRSELQASSNTLNQTIREKSQTGLWIIIVTALIFIILAFIFGKAIAKRKNEVENLSAKADKLNEEIVYRLSTEMNDIQVISKQIGALVSAPGVNTESEQKLITTLADRITFMEMTLYKMDNSVRGHKQLSKSIKQMKDNLLVNGYELVDMLGKDYHEGMKVTANFVEDEELPEGKQIITGIIKPQINYKGKMIQSAQITVSQNI